VCCAGPCTQNFWCSSGNNIPAQNQCPPNSVTLTTGAQPDVLRFCFAGGDCLFLLNLDVRTARVAVLLEMSADSAFIVVFRVVVRASSLLASLDFACRLLAGRCCVGHGVQVQHRRLRCGLIQSLAVSRISFTLFLVLGSDGTMAMRLVACFARSQLTVCPPVVLNGTSNRPQAARAM
jgi:hypothetical protein